MKELICIVCPIGCRLNVMEDGKNLSVTGNKCQRGAVYAKEEIYAPKRIVTATCKIANSSLTGSVNRVPVKTSTPCLRENIPALLDDIYKTMVTLPVKTGDVIITDWKGKGIDIIATRNLG